MIALGATAAEKSFQILRQLRGRGWKADGLFNPQSLKSQLRYADSLGMRFCLILGENELKENSVALRDLQAQSQTKVPMDELFPVLEKEFSSAKERIPR